MALIYVKNKFDVDFETAYVRVKKISFSMGVDSQGMKTRSGEAIVFIYPDKESRIAEGETLDVKRVNLNFKNFDDDGNCIKQVYDYLKTLPEFADASDDMEVVQARPPVEPPETVDDPDA